MIFEPDTRDLVKVVYVLSIDCCRYWHTVSLLLGERRDDLELSAPGIEQGGN
jgi:hypothetical protein